MKWNAPRESIDRDVARRHPGAELTDPPPSEEDPRQAKRDARALLPWGRRFVAWVTDFHKFVTALLSISALTIGVHVWLKGLITRAELELAVEASVEKAVTKVLLDVRTDVANLKDATAGLPQWRSGVDVTLGKIDTRITAVEHQGEKNENRLNTYLVTARSR